MKVYLDIIFLIDFSFNFVLLFSVNSLLKRNTSIKNIILASIFGSISIFTLFLDMNNITLMIFKFLVSLIMIYISFGYKNFKYLYTNLIYLYISSIMLGGFIHFINVQINYSSEDLTFYKNNLNLNVGILLLISPIILYSYIKQTKLLKSHYNDYYEVNLHLHDNKILKLSGFLDTGNKLYDPFKNRPIILVNSSELERVMYDYKMLLVPYESLNDTKVLTCIEIAKVDVVGHKVYEKVLVGISNNQIKIDGVSCILHKKLLEG